MQKENALPLDNMMWPTADIHILNGAEIFPNLKYCLFDLEATLFWSEEFKDHNYKQAIHCLTQVHNLPSEKAELALFSKREELCNILGYPPALSSTLCELGISLNEWANYQSLLSASILPRDPELVRYLFELRSKYQLLMYTNMCQALTEAVLDQLEIRSIFHHFVSAQTIGYTKPSKQAIHLLIERCLIQPNLTIAFGDRYFLDVKPITDVGGWGYVVHSREDLFTSFDLLLQSSVRR